MDRQEKIKGKEGSENGSENGSNEESDTEEKVSCIVFRLVLILYFQCFLYVIL